MAAPTRRRCLIGGAVLRLYGPRVTFALPSNDAARYLGTERGAVPQSVPFWKFVEKRRSEASRSVLFAISSQEKCHDLMRECRAHGDVSRCFYYSLPTKHFALVEFASMQVLQSFLHCVQPFPPEPKILQVPTRTRMVFMGGGPARQATRNQNRAGSSQPCPVEEETSKVISSDDLLLYGSISDQIKAVYESHRQTELSTRLRFYICSVLEEALCGGLLSFARIRPFGSSLSGLGRRDTDLDMNLVLQETKCKPLSAKEQPGKPTFRFMTKTFGAGYDRHLRDQILKLIFNAIAQCIPQMHSVTAIPAAKVPIIKFRHDMSRFECDLSIFSTYGSSRGSLAMAATEMLYILGEADDRFRPLTFALRHWAKENQITRETNGPTPYLTNFQLALLAVHFLQMKKVLPEVQGLIVPPAAGCEYKYGQNYSFLPDYSKLPVSENRQTVGELFEEFFQYYATFNFSKQAVTVLSSSLPSNSGEVSPLYIVNPQEPELNVSKNVSAKELQLLQTLCRKSADILDSTRSPSLCSVLNISRDK